MHHVFLQVVLARILRRALAAVKAVSFTAVQRSVRRQRRVVLVPSVTLIAKCATYNETK